MIAAKLVYRNGGRRGERVPLVESHFSVGRHQDCSLRLNSIQVSRRHCLIKTDDDGVWLTDLGSRNGTLLNGNPIDPNRPYAIGHRDRLEIGQWKFRFSIRDAKTKTPVTVDRPKAHDEKTSSRNAAPHSSAEAILKELDQLADKMESRNKSARGKEPAIDVAPVKTVLKDSHSEPSDSQAVKDRPKPDRIGPVPTGGLESEPTTVSSTESHHLRKLPDSEDSSEQPAGPRKLPANLRPKGPADSKNAALEALKRHFSR